MKIAFLTTLDPEDTNTWSGTLYHILLTLLKSHDVKIVGQNMIVLCKRKHIPQTRYARIFSCLWKIVC